METRNLLLAAALSGLAFASSANEVAKKEVPAHEKSSKEVQCFGMNSCKGTSACHGEKNSCATKNSCKGKGWLKVSQNECEAKKGTFKK